MPPGPPTLCWTCPCNGSVRHSTNGVSVYYILCYANCPKAKQYGDIFSVKVLGRTMIVISSPTISKEVIDKHANASGNRPNSAIIQMIVPDGLNLGLTCHGQ